VRRQVLGPEAPPLLVVGPRPLRRALHAYAQLEPLTFVYLDNAATLVGVTPSHPVATLPCHQQPTRPPLACWCASCSIVSLSHP
jgi:hypothetical protein